MTKEQAIKYLRQIYPNGGHCWLDEQRIEAIGMAIQTLQEEPVSEELEEKAAQLSQKYFPNEENIWARPNIEAQDCKNACIEMAKWQKEKMMAKAIGGVVTFDYYDSGDKTYGCVAHDSFCLEDFGLKDRDEVKIIVIKNDEH